MQFPVGTLGAKSLCELKFFTGASVEGESPKRFSCRKIESGAGLLCRMAENPALERRMQRCQARDVEPDTLGIGSAASAHRTTGKNQLGRNARKLTLPPGFFVLRQLSHVREVLAEARIPSFQKWEQLVANAITREGEMAVGGVFAPRLTERAKIGLDFGAGYG